MTRFLYVILMNLYRGPFMIPLMRHLAAHPEKYTEEQRYELARHAIRIMERTGRVHTEAYGLENLPAEGGYIMYPNHEGRYDALGIMTTHDEPCSFVIDDKRSHGVLVREFTDLLQGKRIMKDNVRQAMALFNQMTAEITEGRRYVLFPEGGYTEDKKNDLREFRPGSFKLAQKTKAPIVPVALIDTYKVFDGSRWDNRGAVKTIVNYLEPIFYDEYKGMRTSEIAEMVQERIAEAIEQYYPPQNEQCGAVFARAQS